MCQRHWPVCIRAHHASILIMYTQLALRAAPRPEPTDDAGGARLALGLGPLQLPIATGQAAPGARPRRHVRLSSRGLRRRAAGGGVRLAALAAVAARDESTRRDREPAASGRALPPSPLRRRPALHDQADPL